MKRTKFVLILSLLFIAGCAKIGSNPTPSTITTPTVAITASPTTLATLTIVASPSPALMPTPVPESRWLCDPSGGVACFAFLSYVTMLSADEGWAFGENGVRLHYTTVSGDSKPTWQVVQPLDRSYGALQTLSMVSATEGWAVLGGHIFHFQEGNWEKVWGSGYISDLVMLNAIEGWAVGDDGIILRYRQGSWESVPSPTRNSLLGIAMLNATEGWAVGMEATVLHYYNQHWESVSVSQADYYSRWLSEITIVSPTEMWVIGDTILHYQNGTWQEITLDRLKNKLNKASFISPDEAWAVGDYGTIFHYDNEQWQESDSPTDKSLLSIDMVNPNEGWAVGTDSTILHYDNDQWQVESTAIPRYLRDVAVLEDGTAWAVGISRVEAGSICAIWYYKDGQWQLIDGPIDDLEQKTRLNAIDMVNPTEGWIVGENGTILHYTQGKWQIFPSPTTKTITDLDMINEQEGWATGFEGLILHYVNSEWQEVISPTGSSIVAIDMLNAGEGWAVADTILHYQNGVWQQIPLALDGIMMELWDIDVVDKQTGWAVGSNGLILRYQNGLWRQVDTPVVNDQLLTVAALTVDEAWASGGQGNILHYQNGQWQIVERPGSFGIQSIMLLGRNEGWAVGNGILHYTNQ